MQLVEKYSFNSICMKIILYKNILHKYLLDKKANYGSRIITNLVGRIVGQPGGIHYCRFRRVRRQRCLALRSTTLWQAQEDVLRFDVEMDETHGVYVLQALGCHDNQTFIIPIEQLP